MKIETPTPFRVELGSRVKELLDKADLTVDGFAAFLKLQPSQFIHIIKGEAVVSNELLHEIARAFGVRLILFFNIGTPLPARLTKSHSLIIFKRVNEDKIEYFVSKSSNEELINFFYDTLLYSKLLTKPVYLKEIQNFAKEKGLNIPSHLLIRYLDKMIDAGLVIKNMALLQLKDGSYGKREVAVYSRNLKAKKIKN